MIYQNFSINLFTSSLFLHLECFIGPDLTTEINFSILPGFSHLEKIDANRFSTLEL